MYSHRASASRAPGVACAIALVAIAGGGGAQGACPPEAPQAATAAPSHRSDRLIIRLAAPGVAASERASAASLDDAEATRRAAAADARLESLRRALGAKSLAPLFTRRPHGQARAAILSTAATSARDAFLLVELAPAQDLDAALASARDHPEVRSAQPDFVYTPDLVPNDPCFPEQYAHPLTRATQAWDLETGDPDVTIAVIGVGIDRAHPDLLANMWENTGEVPDNGIDDDGNGFVDDRHGWDFLDDDPDPVPDEDPHETQVAGVAAAVGNNSIGVAGTAWNVRIMTLRVEFTSSSVARAIAYAQDNGARVINMSFGNYDVTRYGPDTAVETAVEDAFAAGIVLVATAGNDSIKTPRFPAALRDVISVAASDAADGRAAFSNWGSPVSLAAPGEGIVTTSRGAEYRSVNGTSYAAPFVSGLAALLLSKQPGLAPTDVRRRIEYGAAPIATDHLIGAGRADAFRAITLDADPELFALIKSPLDGEVLRGPEVVGTALGNDYQLEYRRAGEPGWLVIGSGFDAVDGVLGSLASVPLEGGFHELRLTARHGAEIAAHQVTFFRADLLTGWPRGTASAVWTGPSYADVDADGDLELFATDLSGAVHGWHHDGVPLADWPVRGNIFAYGSPAIGDIDGDGRPEILQGSFAGGVHAWHADGTEVEGWPQLEDAPVRGAVALADIDGDAALEVVAAGLSSVPDPDSGDRFGVVHVWRGDGNDLPGWPVLLDPNVQSTPAIGDIDGDGDLEVVVKQQAKLYAWHHDGVAVAGWPVEVGGSQTAPILLDVDADGSDEVIASGGGVHILAGDGSELASAESGGGASMAAGDVDGDGRPELCVASTTLALFDLGLNILPGWPIALGSLARCVMGDVDGDGLQEVVAVTQAGEILAWNGDGSVAAGEWPLSVGAPIWQAPALGDLDGNGSLELMVGNDAGELLVFALGARSAPASLAWPVFQGSERHDGRLIVVPEPPVGAQGWVAALALAWLRRRRCASAGGPG